MLLIILVLWVYTVAWTIPFFISYVAISYWNDDHIIYLDSQLSKDPQKYKRMSYMSIGTRFFHYCLLFPFIRKRAKSLSMKINLFMWLNFTYLFSLLSLMLINGCANYIK